MTYQFNYLMTHTKDSFINSNSDKRLQTSNSENKFISLKEKNSSSLSYNTVQTKINMLTHEKTSKHVKKTFYKIFKLLRSNLTKHKNNWLCSKHQIEIYLKN